MRADELFAIVYVAAVLRCTPQRDYMAHKNDAATYEFYKRHEEAVLTALAEGRKPPRRPKRSELIGIPEYRALLERGMPNRDLTTARDESFLKEGLFAAEPVMPTKDSCNPELQERKRGQGEDDDVSDNEGVGKRKQEPADADVSDADAVAAQTSAEDQPRSRTERRARRNLIVDDDDLVPVDSGASAAAGQSQEGAAGGATDVAPSTPTAPAGQEAGGETETAAMAVKSPEEKREGDDKSNLPTACCTGSPASHKDHKEGVDSLEGQPVKAEPIVAAASQAQADDTKREVPVATTPAAAGATAPVQGTEGQTKAESSPDSDRSDLKSNGGDKAAKSEAANTPRVQRLLIFTQFQLVLDELEAYCKYRGWRYLR